MERVTRHGGWAIVVACGLAICAAAPVAAAQLQTRTIEAFDRYVQQVEGRMNAEVKAGRPFLWVDALPDAARANSYSRLRQGEVLIREVAAGEDLPGGMVHDWIAVAFVPRATLAQTVAQLQDYNNDYKTYAPEVLRSKLLQREDGRFSVFMRLRKKSFVTVVLDVNNEVRYFGLDSARAYSRSYSTRIVEVEDTGTPQERERQVGDDHGYLWRLYTYWRFWQKDGGVYVQCEAIALTRGIPYGLGWLIKPYVSQIPKESLLFTMTKTREAIEENASDARSARAAD